MLSEPAAGVPAAFSSAGTPITAPHLGQRACLPAEPTGAATLAPHFSHLKVNFFAAGRAAFPWGGVFRGLLPGILCT